MGCGTNFVKYWLFIFNMLIAIIAVGMIVVGVGFLVHWQLTRDIQLMSLVGTDWALICIGLATLASAFFGCCCFIRGSFCGVVMYTTVLLVIILAQVAIGVVLFLHDASSKEEYIASFHELFRKKNDGDRGSNFIIENLQEEINCCGAEGAQDYGRYGLPPSCCAPGTYECNVDRAYPGCVPTLIRLSKNWSHTSTAAVFIGIACFELIGFVFAVCHANSIRNEARRSRY